MSESAAPTTWWGTPSERAIDCAQDHLERLGYRVLARQFEGADLIAARWPQLLACEVRARRIVEPADDERPTARRSLRLSTSAWLARKAGLSFEEIRFDRIDVYLSLGGQLVGLEHHPNAF